MKRFEGSTRRSAVNDLEGILDFIVESRIRLDAVERVLRDTNPLMHELYLGEVENLRKQEAQELKRELWAATSQPKTSGGMAVKRI